ncbi:transposase [Gammaproteobacteria bacterium]
MTTSSIPYHPDTAMNSNLASRISQFWTGLQNDLFPFLVEEEHLLLTPVLERLIRVLEFIGIERFIPSSRGFVGRPPKDRIALARAFVAKAVLNLPTTEALIDRLQVDRTLRRICGFDVFNSIPDASRFSRAFAEFSEMELPAQVHEALIRQHLGDQIIGHIARDSTEIEAREKPAPKTPESVAVTPPIQPPLPMSNELKDSGVNGTTQPQPIVASVSPPVKKRGRPRKGEERPKEPTVLETQVGQSIREALANLPIACDVGNKTNSKGFKETWTEYKLHIDTADGDIPVTAILTSASVHDSQAAIPLMRLTGERVTYLYDLADSAYCSAIIRDVSRLEGHVPIIEHNPRRGTKLEFAPHEAERYKTRTQMERVNGHLKDYHGGNHI